MERGGGRRREIKGILDTVEGSNGATRERTLGFTQQLHEKDLEEDKQSERRARIMLHGWMSTEGRGQL